MFESSLLKIMANTLLPKHPGMIKAAFQVALTGFETSVQSVLL